MLEGLAKKFASAIMAGVKVPDVDTFEDPVALEVPWRPLPKSNSRFRTHELTDDGAGTLKFTRPLWGYAVAALIAAGCLGFPIYTLVTSGHASLCTAPFALIGLIFVWPTTRTFDLNQQKITLGESSYPFSAVHALQLLAYEGGGEESSYTTYQLNLVMKDRSRVNLLDHGDLVGIRDDARRLAEHLKVNLWDGPAAPQISGEAALQLLGVPHKPGA